MKVTRHVLWVLPALFAMLGGTFELHRRVGQQRDESAALATRAATLERELAALRQKQQVTQRDLEAAAQQLGQLPPPPNSAEGSREAELRAWVGRVKRLRQLFAERPTQAIPELQLLSDTEWLRLARTFDFATEERTRGHLASAREGATVKFTQQLSRAIGKYMRTSNGEMPAAILALVPYFDGAPDLAMLQRYELTPTPDRKNSNGTAGWAVQEIAPIDPDYDARHQIYSNNGAGRYPAPGAWIPGYRERVILAQQAYLAAHPGTPATNMAAVLPFFDPPLDAASTERVLAAERRRKQ